MRSICCGFWLILFVLSTFIETAVCNSGRFWAICSSDEQCQNGGSCLHHSCVCDFGYTGSNCEAKLECNDYSCVNNGTCVLDLKTNRTFCSCNQHTISDGRFEGVFCERKEPCHAVGYCLNGGICQRDPYVTDAFFCECRDGFTGPVCQERTSCLKNDACLNGGVCDFNACSCDVNSGYTGFFCELEVTPAVNYTADFYWAFNRQSSGFKGAAKVVRDPQMGNALSLLKAGGGWVELGKFDNICIKDFNNCQRGISVSFWLQFIDGVNVMAITNANNTILSVQVKDNRNLLIQLTAGANRWQITRSCFPVDWFHVTITWNHKDMLYYENGQLLSSVSLTPSHVNISSPADASLLSVGGINGQGGFSTMQMSDLALWTRVLSRNEVNGTYLKKLSSPLTKRCLSNPCSSNQWCEDDSNNSRNFTCIEPAGFYCSFDSGYCQWQNASSNHQYWMRFSEYDSLRHDHMGNSSASCAGFGKFLGLAPHGLAAGSKVSSDIISQTFPAPSVPGQKVSLSMWYYTEGWTRKNLYLLIQGSVLTQTLFTNLTVQTRQWKHMKIEFLVNATFQVILRGEFNGSGGIFLDDIFVETFSLPVVLSRGNTSYSTSLNHESIFMNCSVYNSLNITWYFGKNRVKQGPKYSIYRGYGSGTSLSALQVMGTDCQVAGNYTCVAVNKYGSDQRQFTLTILDKPRPPSNVVINLKTKQITWTKVAGYGCLPKSHFVVEYKKSKSVTWKTAGYFDNRRFDLVNASKGEKYDVRIYAQNIIGTSPKSRTITFWTNIEPSEIQLFVNQVAAHGAKRILLRRGVQVSLRCEAKAEPGPSFSWMVPRTITSLSASGPYRVSGIKWRQTLFLRSMNCRNSGTFWCRLHNLGKQKLARVAIGVTEPDPPKTFSVVFVNITTVLISWSAYECNDLNPSAITVRYRQEGASTWIERLFKSMASNVVLTGQFHYKSVYEFISRLAYDGRVGAFSQVIKRLSPELEVFFYNVTFKILSEVYRPELADGQSIEFLTLSKEVRKLMLQAFSQLPEPKTINVISFEGPGTTTAHVRLNIAYSNTLLLEWVLRTFIRVNNKQNGTLHIDADNLTLIQEPDCRRKALGMENGAISDAQISASSEWDSSHSAIQGRLNFKATGVKSGGWCAGVNDVNQWLQIDLIGQHTRVTRVATQGRNGNLYLQWVTNYKLQYSNGGVNFLYYREHGQITDKVFAGNADQDTVVSHDLNPPIRARYIRFRPVAWYGHISMRVELYDCPQGLTSVAMTTHFSGQAGTTMTIYCTAVGLAISTFSWTKDHVTLQPSYRVKYDVNSTCSVLTIRMTSKTDSGNYTCNVSNHRTSLKETIFVGVSEPPKAHIRPLVRTLFEGESVTFQCGLSRGNISQLHVAWYEKAGNSQEKLIISNNDSFTLTVQRTLTDSMESHVILYRCTVQNTDGVSSSPSAKLVVLRKEDKAICVREVSYGVTWAVTSAGMIDKQGCPNAAGRAVRPCLKTNQGTAKWGQVDFADCMSNQIRKIQNEVLAVTEGYRVNKTLRGILEDLENVTAAYKIPSPGKESRSMYEKDLTASVDALTRLIKYNAANRTRPLSNKHDINNLVKTSSNLLEVSNLQAWKTALKVKDNLAYQMVSALDVYGHHSANKSRDIHINADNVVLIAVKVSSNSSAATKGLQMTHGQSSLDLPSTLFSQTNNTVTIVSVIFSTLEKVLTSTEALKKLNSSHSNSSDWFLNSRLASITVRPRLPDVINPPFKLALETNKVTIAGSKRICVFLNLSSEYNKGWSTEGCSVVSSRTNSTTTTCACDHMTLFAVLMDASGDTTGDASHRTALSWISIVGCMLSLIGILVTLLVMFCFWKKLRSPRTVVLVNLCVAIGVTNMLIVAMEIADLQNQTGCTVLAVLLHFFLLSIFCWMLSEGVQLYFSLVKVIGAAADPHIKLFYCLGWGLPALIVAVSLAATQGRGYANMQTCWLSTRNHVLWAFVAPALLIVSGNVVVFALVIYNMLSSHRLRKEPLTRRCQRGLKASFVLLPVLGISWSFGVLTMTSNKIIFNYIFAIFNSLQGFLVFVFHCVFNKQIRDVLNERKRKQAGFATDAMTAHSNRKLSTTTNTTQGTNSRLSLATHLRILNLQMFRSEISPSPHPSPTPSRTRAFEETSIVSASPITPRVERDNLLRGNRAEKREENQESSDYVKDEVKTRESSSPNKPSNNMCDMDERDWTSLESSSVSIVDCSGDEELMETRTNRSVKC